VKLRLFDGGSDPLVDIDTLSSSVLRKLPDELRRMGGGGGVPRGVLVSPLELNDFNLGELSLHIDFSPFSELALLLR